MKKWNLILLISIVLTSFETFAQHVTFPDDNINRGYTDRPYKRYEAETGKCQPNGIVLQPNYDQTTLQSEASNQVATQLIDKDSYIQWTNDEAADGLTIRFSLPDGVNGEGTSGTLALYVNDQYVQNITLNSYWAWQYTVKYGSPKYPDNTPSSSKFARMKFDEMHVKLASKIPIGATFKLVKSDPNTTPYTIDYVELEPVPDPVTYESIADANKVLFDSSVPLARFILDNGGKTIYIPAGKYAEENRIMITTDNTKLIGAGMWYTEINFTASSDNRTTYANRGIETNNSGIVIDGLYLSTINNKRYYNNNANYQVGKGFMGGFGTNSVIRNVWVEHFECGGWIANYGGKGSYNLLIEHCRFRNNYADGFNLCQGINNAVVQKCSFRNNGDDDMATWSSGEMCVNNTFRYSTAENNWRASSIGFFGGQQNKAINCVIIDPMEAGFRANCDFAGVGFSTTGVNEFRNISVYRGGVAGGTVGVSGDFWGSQQGAVHLYSSSNYQLRNVKLDSIDLYDSKYNAVYIGSGGNTISNLQLKNISIFGTGWYGLFYSWPNGTGSFCNINYSGVGATTNANAIPSGFLFVEDCTNTAVETLNSDNPKIMVNNKTLTLIGCLPDTSISIFDSKGVLCYHFITTDNKAIFENMTQGIYFVKIDNMPSLKALIP
jgi:hypothetical protein